MERFVRRQNVEHYREMLKIITDPVQRRMIEKLLLEEEAKIKKAEKIAKRNSRAFASRFPLLCGPR